MKINYAILGLVAHEPLSGYQIKKRMEVSLGFFWGSSYGQIYPSLKNMSDEGYITGENIKQDLKPDKNSYSITEKGKEALRKWLSEPPVENRIRLEILLKTFFGHHGSKEHLIEHLKSFKVNSQKDLSILKLMHTQLDFIQEEPDHIYYRITISAGISYFESMIRWSDETIEQLIQIKELEPK